MTTTGDLPRLLHRDEAAKRLAVSISQLDRLVRARRIDVVRLGRSVRFTEAALGRFVVANEHSAPLPRHRPPRPAIPINRHVRHPRTSRSFRDDLS